MKTARFLTLGIASLAVLLSPTALAQGPLNPPPGPPAPNMKTLTQIEPRIEISAANTPGDSGSVFLIKAPGSYYLSGNVTAVIGMNGLGVESRDVRIDLNGFTMMGAKTSTGILIAAGFSGVELHNGGVRDFETGVSGVSNNIRVRDLMVGAGTTGILLGAGALVENCTISDCQTGITITAGRVARCTVREVVAGISLTGTTNAGTVADCTVQSINPPANNRIGISAGEGAVISGCSVRGFGGSGIGAGEDAAISGCTAIGNGWSGISAGYGSSITNCAAKSNVTSGISTSHGSTIENCAARLNGGTGIHAGGYSVVKNCTAYANGGTGINGSSGGTIMGSVVTSNDSHGIVLDHRGTVQGCSITHNAKDGIYINGILSLVKENNVHFNGTDAPGGAGIHVTNFGGGHRIERNHVSGNYRGIFLEQGGNILLGNSSAGNHGAGPAPAPDYWMAGGANIVGTIVESSAGLNNANNNANANIR